MVALTNITIKEAVAAWVISPPDATIIYGDISVWDVSEVTDMVDLFKFNNVTYTQLITIQTGWDNYTTITQTMPLSLDGIKEWDVSSVTDMSNMFATNHIFNGDISLWDVSAVTNMQHMFRSNFSSGRTKFNGDISSWDVSSVTDMNNMFTLSSFNGDISSWDVSSVTDMNNMFTYGLFTGVISLWDVSAVIDMSFMFNYSLFNGDISLWDVSAVTNMSYMFRDTPFNGDISLWDVSAVTNMSYMFVYNDVFDGDLSTWLTFRVTTYTYMFTGAISSGYPDTPTNTNFNKSLTLLNLGGALSYLAGPTAEQTFFTDKINATTEPWVVPNPMVFTNKSLKYAVVNWYGTTTQKTIVDGWFGSISTWDTTPVTSMEGLFMGISNLTDDIGIWNTSNVTNMSNMFNNATIALNANNTLYIGDIESWYTGNVTNMSGMFGNTSNFIQPISNLDTSNVTNMSNMFNNAQLFNQYIGNWNTSNVTNMANMFNNAYAFNKYIGNWNTSNVTDMSHLFDRAEVFNQPLGRWNTSNVTDMKYMFSRAYEFNQNINTCMDQWNTSNVTDMKGMFSYSQKFNQPIGQWDTSSVTNMNNMFYGTDVFNQPIGDWNTSIVTDMNYMFYSAYVFNQPIGDWNTSNVTDLQYMFFNAYVFNQPIGDWNTSNVTDMKSMFYNAPVFNQEISYWDTTTVTDMNNMFYGATSMLNNGYPSTPTSANFNRITDANFFTALSAWFTDSVAATVMYGNIITWDTSQVTTMRFAFQDRTLFNEDISNWNTSNVTDMYGMFYNANAFNQDIGTKLATNSSGTTYTAWDTSKVTIMDHMFWNANVFNNGGITYTIGNWNTSNVTTMGYMFFECRAFNIPVTTKSVIVNNNTYVAWNTHNVTTMLNMFRNADVFNQPIGNWDTSKVTNMSGMFRSAPVFNQYLEYWNTINVTNYTDMFLSATAMLNNGYPSTSTSANFNNTPTTAITNSNFFTAITAMKSNSATAILTYGYIEGWDTSPVTNMEAAFKDWTTFNGDISRWDTSNVTNMSKMFWSATSFNQYIGNWNTSNVTTMNHMFWGANIFNQYIDTKSVTVLDGTDYTAWDTSIVTTMESMFYQSNKFNQDISNWDVSNVAHMKEMLRYATDFNQISIRFWTLRSGVTMSAMLNSSALESTISLYSTSAVLNWFTTATVTSLSATTIPDLRSTLTAGYAADNTIPTINEIYSIWYDTTSTGLDPTTVLNIDTTNSIVSDMWVYVSIEPSNVFNPSLVINTSFQSLVTQLPGTSPEIFNLWYESPTADVIECWVYYLNNSDLTYKTRKIQYTIISETWNIPVTEITATDPATKTSSGLTITDLANYTMFYNRDPIVVSIDLIKVELTAVAQGVGITITEIENIWCSTADVVTGDRTCWVYYQTQPLTGDTTYHSTQFIYTNATESWTYPSTFTQNLDGSWTYPIDTHITSISTAHMINTINIDPSLPVVATDVFQLCYPELDRLTLASYGSITKLFALLDTIAAVSSTKRIVKLWYDTTNMGETLLCWVYYTYESTTGDIVYETRQLNYTITFSQCNWEFIVPVTIVAGTVYSSGLTGAQLVDYVELYAPEPIYETRNVKYNRVDSTWEINNVSHWSTELETMIPSTLMPSLSIIYFNVDIAVLTNNTNLTDITSIYAARYLTQTISKLYEIWYNVTTFGTLTTVAGVSFNETDIIVPELELTIFYIDNSDIDYYVIILLNKNTRKFSIMNTVVSTAVKSIDFATQIYYNLYNDATIGMMTILIGAGSSPNILNIWTNDDNSLYTQYSVVENAVDIIKYSVFTVNRIANTLSLDSTLETKDDTLAQTLLFRVFSVIEMSDSIHPDAIKEIYNAINGNTTTIRNIHKFWYDETTVIPGLPDVDCVVLVSYNSTDYMIGFATITIRYISETRVFEEITTSIETTDADTGVVTLTIQPMVAVDSTYTYTGPIPASTNLELSSYTLVPTFEINQNNSYISTIIGTLTAQSSAIDNIHYIWVKTTRTRTRTEVVDDVGTTTTTTVDVAADGTTTTAIEVIVNGTPMDDTLNGVTIYIYDSPIVDCYVYYSKNDTPTTYATTTVKYNIITTEWDTFGTPNNATNRVIGLSSVTLSVYMELYENLPVLPVFSTTTSKNEASLTAISNAYSVTDTLVILIMWYNSIQRSDVTTMCIVNGYIGDTIDTRQYITVGISFNNDTFAWYYNPAHTATGVTETDNRLQNITGVTDGGKDLDYFIFYTSPVGTSIIPTGIKFYDNSVQSTAMPPIGTIILWAGTGTDNSGIPTGYLLCNGAGYSTVIGNVYYALYGVIGSKYGNSGTDFRVPDLIERFPMGYASGLANDINYTGDTGSGVKLRCGGNSMIHGTQFIHTHKVDTSRAVTRGNYRQNADPGSNSRRANADVYYSDTQYTGYLGDTQSEFIPEHTLVKYLIRYN